MTIQKLPTTALEDLNMRRRVVETLNQITQAPTWIAPTLLNGWANFGGGFNPAGYYRDALGRVHLRGLLLAGTVTANTALFQLPEGYRPANLCLFCASGSDAGVTADDSARVDIATSGDVLIVSFHVAGGGGAGSYLSLDGISFLAEQ